MIVRLALDTFPLSPKSAWKLSKQEASSKGSSYPELLRSPLRVVRHKFQTFKDWILRFEFGVKFVVRRPLVLKAPPLDVRFCCFISILLLSIVISCLVLKEPLFRLLRLMMTVYFPFCFVVTPRCQTCWKSEKIFPHYFWQVKYML